MVLESTTSSFLEVPLYQGILNYLPQLLGNFSLAGLILGIIGISKLFKKNIPLFVLLGSMFLVNVLIFAQYSTATTSKFLPSFLIFSIFVGIGLYEIAIYAKMVFESKFESDRKGKSTDILKQVAIFLIICIIIYNNSEDSYKPTIQRAPINCHPFYQYRKVYILIILLCIMNSFVIWALQQVKKKNNKTGNRLLEISDKIDWVPIRNRLDEMYNNKSEKGGRPNSDVILMFKILILQQWFGLSDLEVERQIADRLSFMEFLGYPEPFPDSSTIWLFRERMAKTGKDAICLGGTSKAA